MKHHISVMVLVLSNCLGVSLWAEELVNKPELYRVDSHYRAVYASYYDSENYDKDIQIVSLNLDQGYYLFRNFYLLGGSSILLTKGQRTEIGQRGESRTSAQVMGAALSALMRLDVITHHHNSVFIDGGFGFLLTAKEFPPGGTIWNFMSRYGVGLSISIEPQVNLIMGVRHIHISNGKGYGHSQNPAYDGNGLYGGVIYDF